MKPLASLFLITVMISVRAQTYQLRSHETELSVPYAHISFKKSASGTYSDLNGYFLLKENIDSISITHINFHDTTMTLSQIDSVIFLTPRAIILNEIVITDSESIRIVPKSKFKEYNSFLNISSFEIGTIFRNSETQDYELNKVIVPVKIGMDEPILRINIYSFNEIDNRPENLKVSAVFDGYGDVKKSISIDLDKYNIEFENGNPLFVSIELIGYKQGNELKFKEYGNIKSALRIKMRKIDRENCFIRTKNSGKNWSPISIWSEDIKNHEPSIYLELRH